MAELVKWQAGGIYGDGRLALVFDHPRQAQDVIGALVVFCMRAADSDNPMDEPLYTQGTPGHTRVLSTQTVLGDLHVSGALEVLNQAVAEKGMGG